jgi:hypothetical protein
MDCNVLPLLQPHSLLAQQAMRPGMAVKFFASQRIAGRPNLHTGRGLYRHPT